MDTDVRSCLCLCAWCEDHCEEARVGRSFTPNRRLGTRQQPVHTYMLMVTLGLSRIPQMPFKAHNHAGTHRTATQCKRSRVRLRPFIRLTTQFDKTAGAAGSQDAVARVGIQNPNDESIQTNCCEVMASGTVSCRIVVVGPATRTHWLSPSRVMKRNSVR